MAKRKVILIGCLDTKGTEYQFCKERIEEAGVGTFVIDCSVSNKPYFKPDVSAEEVAALGGVKLSDLYSNTEQTRAPAIKNMGISAQKMLNKLVSESDEFGAVLALGGTGGTAMFSPAFRSLPLGFPKMMVSTMASGNTREYVGTSDMMMANSVTDIAGLNRISQVVLANASHAAAGMAANYDTTLKFKSGSKPLIAITMFGITTPAVLRIRADLEAKGFDVITFHAVGQGAAMEQLIDLGMIDGVIDFTLPEILNHKNGGIFDPGPGRMEAAIRKGIPEVVSFGAAECFNFGGPGHVPAEFDTPEHHVLVHNAQITNLRGTADELVYVGEYVAEHVNKHPGPKAVIMPLLGLDKLQSPGSAWFGPEKNEPLYKTIREKLDKNVELIEKKNHINDEEFADATAELFFKVWDKRKK